MTRGKGRYGPTPKVTEESSVEEVLAAVAEEQPQPPAEPEAETQSKWDIFVSASERSETQLTIERPVEVVRTTNGDLGIRFLTPAEAQAKQAAPGAPPPPAPSFDLGKFEEMLHQELSERGIQLNRGAFASIVQRALARKPTPAE